MPRGADGVAGAPVRDLASGPDVCGVSGLGGATVGGGDTAGGVAVCAAGAAANGVIPAACHHTVDMDVVFQALAPRVQDHCDAEFTPKPLRVPPKGLQGSCGALKQETIEQAGVVVGEGVQGMGQGKHAVEVRDRQQVTETRFHPAHFRQRLAFRTVAILA